MRVNPVTLLLAVCNTGQREFERQFSFAHQTIIDTTAGTFEDVPVRVQSALITLCEAKGIDIDGEMLVAYAQPNLDAAYAWWKRYARMQNAGKINSTLPRKSLRSGSKAMSPAHYFVHDTADGPTGFSKLLKVPPSTVQRWINGVTRSTPKAILEALREIDYPSLPTLIELQDQWLSGLPS